jgi:hypothetical protein
MSLGDRAGDHPAPFPARRAYLVKPDLDGIIALVEKLTGKTTTPLLPARKSP